MGKVQKPTVTSEGIAMNLQKSKQKNETHTMDSSWIFLAFPQFFAPNCLQLSWPPAPNTAFAEEEDKLLTLLSLVKKMRRQQNKE